MHGSGGEKWKRSRHMWPVPNSTATTVAVNDSNTPDFFCKDGRKIRVGDCALFKPPQDSPPFIGIIRRLTLDKEDTLSLGVNWLYRPADIRLAKGILQDAALNEVFYSFHKDEIPAASLLHPCKVAFLRKGVELPPGISSFVCRRVYDTENKCLWWLTDKDYINERQEEVDKLLDKTRLEMHGGVQSGGRSPKPLNGPSSTPQLKSGSDIVQNSASSFSSQAKGKKRERGDQGTDSVKRERLVKVEDGDSGQFRPENMIKSEIAKITDKGGLVDLAGVEKLVQLMQPDSADKKIDLAGRIMLVDVIAVTDRYDCLGRFVQLRGLPVLDEWLQEVHKGKIGDSCSPKECDKSVEEFLLALLRALDKLPVNLHALKSCNVGKSVNHLRSHKNSEIQKKARTLVDTWKRRVEAEMNMSDAAKSGPGRGVSWPNKPASSEVSHVGSKKTGNSAEVGSKSSNVQPSVSKAHQVKLGSGDAASKASASPGSTKLMSASVGTFSKDQNFRMLVAAGSSDLPLTPIKEEKSSSSSQSQNNSQSSDHAKTVGSSCREDARSSTAGSVCVNKVSSSGSRHRKAINGFQGSAIAGVQKEIGSGKASTPSRNVTPEKPTTGVSHEKLADVPPVEHGNNRLIVRFPNTGRSPARGASGSSFEDSVATCGRASPPTEKHDNHDKKPKGRNDAVRANISSDINSDLCQGKECGFEESAVPACVEQQRAGEDGEKPTEASKAAGSLSNIISRSGKSYEAPLSSMDALLESCAKISEASASTSPGDDGGMNLLASVAAGEISKSGNVSPSASPGRNPSTPEGSSSGNDGKLKQLGEEVSQAQCQQSIGGVSVGSPSERGNTADSLLAKNESRNPVSGGPTNDSGDMKGVSPAHGDRAGESSVHLDGSLSSQENADALKLSDHKPGEPYDVSVTIPVSARKEGCTDAEGAYQFHEQRKFGVRRTRSISSFDNKLKLETSSDEDKKADKKAEYGDERTVENSVPMASEARSGSAKVEKDNETSTCSSSEVGHGDQNADKELYNDVSTEQKPSIVTASNAEPLNGKSDDPLHSSGSGNTLNVECNGEKTDDVKTGGLAEPRTDGQADLCTTFDRDNDCRKDNLETKESVGHSSVAPSPKIEVHAVAVQESEQCEKSNRHKIDDLESAETEQQQPASVNASGPDSFVKLDFDLNEGFPSDDGSNGDLVKVGEPGSSSGIHLPCTLPFQNSSTSGGFPSSITVAAPAKGAFNPPENLLRSKGELGWKGSAATSAFRPAEPRKTSDAVDSTVSRQGRAPLDFDLNVPDDRAYEDESGPCDRVAGAGGLDLDLNRADESPDVGLFSTSNHARLEMAPLPARSSLSSGLSNGAVNASRDFDLNNGPGLDDVGTEAAPSVQSIKSSLPSAGPVPGIRVNNAEFGNFSSWFPPGNAYSAITVPPIFPGRGEQSYGSPAGSQRVLCPPTASSSFGPEIYRGPVLSSSPAVAFSPANQIPYPGFPFETSFPLSSNSFSGCSPAYMDSSSGGPLCFPTIPSPLMGPAGVVPSAFARPYVMNLPGGASNIGPDGRKWGSQGLDLNAGPGSIDAERRDERLPTGLRQLSVSSSQALVEEQLKMFQVGGVLKRKEPDGGLDAVDRISYKHPSWQ